MAWRSPILISVILTLLSASKPSRADLGIDISNDVCNSVSLGDWQACKAEGFNFAFIEVWRGHHGLTQNASQCASDAWAAGFDDVHLYAFMCPNCPGNQPPELVISTIYKATIAQNVQFTTLWFDIEECDTFACWNDPASNLAYVEAATRHAVQVGFRIGFYSSLMEWSRVLANATSPLFHWSSNWYAHYDGVASFADSDEYRMKSNWGLQPYAKQFTDHRPKCMDADQNWKPALPPP